MDKGGKKLENIVSSEKVISSENCPTQQVFSGIFKTKYRFL